MCLGLVLSLGESSYPCELIHISKALNYMFHQLQTFVKFCTQPPLRLKDTEQQPDLIPARVSAIVGKQKKVTFNLGDDGGPPFVTWAPEIKTDTQVHCIPDNYFSDSANLGRDISLCTALTKAKELASELQIDTGYSWPMLSCDNGTMVFKPWFATPPDPESSELGYYEYGYCYPYTIHSKGELKKNASSHQ